MECNCAVTSKAVLEYIKVFLSTPTVILILGGWFFARFGKEIKSFINNVRNVEAFGAKVAVDKAVIEATEVAVDTTVVLATQSKRDEISLLPPGEDKDAKLFQLEREVAALRQRALASVVADGIWAGLTLRGMVVQGPLMQVLKNSLWYIMDHGGMKDEQLLGMIRGQNPGTPDDVILKAIAVGREEQLKALRRWKEGGLAPNSFSTNG